MLLDISKCHLYVNRIEQPQYLGMRKITVPNEIDWSKYQIKETDFRVKTATFTSPQDLDLTTGTHLFRIISPYHENFTGTILSNEYDENTGLYYYQCQDMSRFYQTKPEFVFSNKTVYHVLETLLTRGGLHINKPHPYKDRKLYKKALSGLRAKDLYSQKLYGNITNKNTMDNKISAIFRNKTYMDLIRSLTIGIMSYVDVYLDSDGVIQIEPLAREDWFNTGLQLVADETMNRKFKFDITNIITGAVVNSSDTGVGNSLESGNLLNLDLSTFFGNIITSIDGSTTEVDVSSNKGSTTNATKKTNKTKSTKNPYGNKTKRVWIDADSGSGDFKKSLAKALRKKGWKVHVGGTGPNYHYKDYWNVTSKYQVLITIYNGFCAGTMREAYSSRIQNLLKKKGVVLVPVFDTRDWKNRKKMKAFRYGDFSKYNAKRAHDDNFSKSNPAIKNVGKWFKNKNAKYCAYPTVAGVVEQFLAGGYFKWKDSKNKKSGKTSSKKTTTSKKTIITANDRMINQAKAKDEIFDASRDLLSLKLTLPLGNPALKKVHTNQFLFTLLPEEYELAYWTVLGQALSSQQNRFSGAKTSFNRWYIEGNTIDVDAGGTGKMSLDLNGLASSQKVYIDAYNSFIKAFNDAVKKQNKQTSSSKSKTNAIKSSKTNKTLKLNQGKTINNLVKKIVGMETNPLKKAKLIHKWLQNDVRYDYYKCVRYGSATNCYKNRKHLNCADIATLTCAMMRAAGLTAYVVHRTSCGGHFWTVIEINGKKYTSDAVSRNAKFNTVWRSKSCGGRVGNGGSQKWNIKCGAKAYC